ncbi:MAG: hypothetical protein AW08_00265 [Candidatus Accumulibacter adjunctus]|uniref:Uncharacterized protein n=1 Tax=Candidatus Accumulibacter adjunctus TaxID=1454001 RepID=A0A011NYP0_9PROT|nr:MAG: hypothetical protein AW08_00265 [Candidatus Accumulibacter adjunctus]
MRIKPLAQGGQARTESQRNGQQEADSENHAERQQTGSYQPPDAGGSRPLRRAPDAIERVLQLGEDRCRANEEKDQAEDRCHGAFGGPARAFQQSLDGQRSRCPQQSLQLRKDFTARGLLAEKEPGDRNHDQQQGSNRKHRVEGQCRSHALGVVSDPVHGSRLEEIQDVPERHAPTPCRSARPRARVGPPCSGEHLTPVRNGCG